MGKKDGSPGWCSDAARAPPLCTARTLCVSRVVHADARADAPAEAADGADADGLLRAFVHQLGVESMLTAALGVSSLHEIAEMAETDKMAVREKLTAAGLSGLCESVVATAPDWKVA